MPEEKEIKWTKLKIFFTVLAYMFSIAVVFMSLLPVVDGSLSWSNCFLIMIGCSHIIRMAEFLFIGTNASWLVWLLGTYTMNAIALYAFNYDDIAKVFQKKEEESGSE